MVNSERSGGCEVVGDCAFAAFAMASLPFIVATENKVSYKFPMRGPSGEAYSCKDGPARQARRPSHCPHQ
jgi:hypothetical protein